MRQSVELDPKQDIFISHASADKMKYISPLTSALSNFEVTFWLDENEIRWGDDVVSKINRGLSRSNFGLVCFSSDFLQRPWPEAEMSSILATQNASGAKKLLPLILNSKKAVLEKYPLIAGLAYREFKLGPRKLAAQIADMVRPTRKENNETLVTVEAVHTGVLCQVRVPPRASVHWLAEMAIPALEVSKELPVSDFAQFHVRWVLVDAAAKSQWAELSRSEKRKVHVLLVSDNGELRVSRHESDRLADLGLKHGTIFHLYAIEDERFDLPRPVTG